MNRTVTASLEVNVLAPARLAVQVAVADPDGYRADETITMTLDDHGVQWSQLGAPHSGRIWLVDAGPGVLRVDYRATLTASPEAPPADAVEELLYLRPSRYCESDRLIGFASRHFRDINEPHDVLAAVSSWVGTQLEYVSGSSGPTDGAVDTLLAAREIGRAHV